MTIHTFETTTLIKRKDYYDIQEVLKQDKSSWTREGKEGMTYFGLSAKGITIKLFRIKKARGYYAYRIYYIISAYRVFNNDSYIDLFNTKNYPKLEHKINKLLNSKTKLLPALETCSLLRIDFCINAILESREQVQAYINTMRKGNVPATLERETDYSKSGKRDVPLSNAMTVTQKNYIEVSLYDKYAQMKQQYRYEYPEEELKKAKNIVRIEIRCMKNKIKALNAKFGLNTIEDYMLRSDEIANYLYEFYLQRMYGTGEIYTLSAARFEMDGCMLPKKQSKALKEILKDCNSMRNATHALNAYKIRYSKHKLKKILQILDEEEISFVTASAEDATHFPDSILPSPLMLYRMYNNQNRE